MGINEKMFSNDRQMHSFGFTVLVNVDYEISVHSRPVYYKIDSSPLG